MLSAQSMRASLQVAPLALAVSSTSPRSSNGSCSNEHQGKTTSNIYIQSEMTPPATPNGSQEDLLPEDALPPPVFHNFLRAFYPFNPSYAMTDSSVTLPLAEGDIILVHSIHTNGWADGTQLMTGARGWLPTNYCEAYEPDDMRNLLKALLNFWDLLRSTSVNDSEIFGNQEFMKGIIAGVRFLLERSNCLNRESVVVLRNDVLRKCRKALLSELSSLVKTAKKLQELSRGTLDPAEDVNDIVDQMILKAFRIVVRAVRFVDVLEDERRARAPAAVTVMATVAEESYVPPTPPADQASFEEQQREDVSDVASRATTDDTGMSVATSDTTAELSPGFPPPTWNKRVSSLGASTILPTAPSSHRLSQSSMKGGYHHHRVSSSISHRVSLAGPSPSSNPGNLVSERLNKSHDKFLSHLGSFIGRLHLQSQSRPELSAAIKQSAISGGELLAVIDEVCAHNNSNSDPLSISRGAMFERIQDLVFSARNTLVNAATAETDVIMPQDNSTMLTTATGCVRAAGDCVAKAKSVIERVGDFELDDKPENEPLNIDLSVLEVVQEERSRSFSDAQLSTTSSTADRVDEDATPRPQRLTVITEDKPLPEVPTVVTPGEQTSFDTASTEPSRPSSYADDNSTAAVAAPSSSHPSLPPLPKLSTSLMPADTQSPIEGSNDSDFHSSRFDSLAASSAGSSATYLSRDSEASIASQTSTRATTPDHSLQPRNQPSVGELSVAASSTLTEEVDEVEDRLMEKTFAHELMFNKEGQVTGGSLPALVERLTAYESAPDVTFLSTFYLTFRLFCTPAKLTEALIDRFEYVGESPHMAGPVRLRVYNAFKGWLESHWRDQTDRDALRFIMHFAETRLSAVLPSAGRRLLDLARRVSLEGDSMSRLVSNMGKTNTSISLYIPADTPLPAPVMTKSQQGLLNTFKNGGNMPTILDFDPLEIARQLTIKQMTIFSAIMPDELLASQWMKKGGANAPNVKAMSSLSTDLSNLVADTILQYSEIKKRAAAIKQWIKIAHRCHQLHNYDGLMAIICSLNSSTISRLRKTWDLVSVKRKDMLRTLQEIVEPSQNNKVLRTLLHDHIPPCLPFLGMYLTDLTFVDIGNPATKQLGTDGESGRGGLTVVNFDKHARTAKIIGELQRFQIPYRLTGLSDMQDWISAQIRRVREGDQGNVQVSYYRKSLLLEPRETASKLPQEPPTPTLTAPPGASRGDLFGWVSRDRSAQRATAAQV